MHSEIIINKGYKGINPIQFGYETCKKSHSYGPATRFYWLFHFVVSGKGVFQIEGREYSLSAGEMFVIPPFVETYYEADSEEPWEYIWVGFEGDLPFCPSDTYHIPEAVSIFERMKATADLGEGKTEFLLSKIWELISFLMEKNKVHSDPIETALHILSADYMTPLSIGEIAKRVHLERTYFSELFRTKTGLSPKQYLLKIRMEKALFWIENGYSVTVAANSVGYQDIYTFSKMFKRYFGKSPSEYKMNRSK